MNTSFTSAHHTHNRKLKKKNKYILFFKKYVKVIKLTDSKKNVASSEKWQWWEIFFCFGNKNETKSCNAITCFSNLPTKFSSLSSFDYLCDWLLSTRKRDGNECSSTDWISLFFPFQTIQNVSNLHRFIVPPNSEILFLLCVVT